MRWFPLGVTGTVVLVIGIPLHLGISAGVLATILLVIATCRGFLANVAVLIGIAAGFVVALALGKVNFSGLDAAGWVQPITPFHFGWPSFDLMTAVSLCVVMIVIMIEGVGQFLALGEVVGRKIGPEDIARGLRADGVGAIVGGVFNAFTYTSYTQNIGLVQVTGVRSRWVCVAAGVILIVLGSLPKLAVLAASIPQYVLGGAALMFGMVAATGIRILGHVDFVHNKKNGYVVAVSVALGMIPLVADKFFAQLPDLAAKFFSNGILLGTFSAVLLNVVMNAGAHARQRAKCARNDVAEEQLRRATPRQARTRL